MRERKKTAVHGTLGMMYRAVEFNFKQICLKTLIPTMIGLKDIEVSSSPWSLNIDGKINSWLLI